MDIRLYFEKVKELEATLPASVLISSLATPDGGVPGTISELSRGYAARMIIDGKARLATEQEAVQYRDRIDRARAEAEQAATAGRVQIAVLSEQEARALRAARQKS